MTLEERSETRLNGLDVLAAFLAAVAAGVVYFVTLAPTVTSGDSGELIAAACTLGVPHPSGYPLYCLIGKAFSLLPVSNPAWRINLMSAFFGALTVGMVYLICRQLSIQRVAAFVGALALAFSRIFWSQSVTAKFYTLNTFLLFSIILLLLLWSDTKKSAFLYAASGVFGLSLSNHYSLMLLVSPAIGIYVLLVRPTVLRNLRLVLGCAGLVLAGLLVYVYLPLAAAREPAMNWGEPSTWHNFWHHVTRAQYRKVDFETGFSLWAKVLYLGHVVRLLWDSFTPFVLVPFGLLGCWALRQRRKECALLGGVFLCNTVLLIMILQVAYKPDGLARVQVYYLPAYACTAIAIAAGLSWAWTAIGAAGAALGTGLRALICLGVVLYPLASNWKHDDMSRNYLAYDFARAALESLEPNAVYFCGPDFSGFPTIYLQVVEGVRRDVLLADMPRYPTPRLRRYLAGLNPPVPSTDGGVVQEELVRRGQRPVYAAPLTGPPERRGCKFDPWGFVFGLRRSEQAVVPGAPAVFSDTALPNLRLSTALMDFDYLVFACYYLMRGERLMSAGRIREAAPDYRKAAEYALPYPVVISDIGVVCLRRCMNREAEEFFRKAVEADPSYAGACENLAVLLDRQGRGAEALTFYRKAQDLDPKLAYARRIAALEFAPAPPGGDVDHRIQAVRQALSTEGRNPELLTELAELCMLRGDLEEALAAYRKAVEVEPGYRPGYEALSRFYQNVVQDPATAASYATKARGLK